MIVPTIISLDESAIGKVSNLLTRDLKLPVRSVKGLFPFVSAFIPQDLVDSLDKIKGVKAIHYDSLNHAMLFNSKLSVLSRSAGKSIEQITEKWITTEETYRLNGMDRALKQGYDGRGSKVSVIDTGALLTHPQLFKRGVQYDTAMFDKNFLDLNGHGTWCTTCVGGDPALSPLGQLTGRSVKGMAQGIDLMAVKCLGFIIGAGRMSDVMLAMQKSIDARAHIISMSLGQSKPDGDDPLKDPTCQMIERYSKPHSLNSNGTIFIVAAGNSGRNGFETIGSPAVAESAIAVGAIDKDHNLADFSSKGAAYGLIKPDCTNYGVDVYSGSTGLLDETSKDMIMDLYATLSGTSMATPHVAGIVAVAKQKYPHLNRDNIMDRLRKKGTKNNLTGYGILSWSLFE